MTHDTTSTPSIIQRINALAAARAHAADAAAASPASVARRALKEECGVFGVIGTNEAAAITALGLHSLQHRGQEAAGIATLQGDKFHTERHLGLVSDQLQTRTPLIG